MNDSARGIDHGAAAGPRAWDCPMCGARVSQDQTACGGCPMSRFGHDCTVLCCPRCGYQFVERSGWLESLSRLWRRKGTS
jgi:hypothetical protein